MKNTINSIGFKSLINKKVDLWACGGEGGGVRAHPSHPPPPSQTGMYGQNASFCYKSIIYEKSLKGSRY